VTGSGGFGGYAPFKFGSVTPEPLREFVPGARELIELVMNGLSPRKVVERALEGSLGTSITDNTKELYLSTTQPDIDELYHAVEMAARDLPAVQFKAAEPGEMAGERKVWVRSEEMGDLQALIHELREKGVSFTVGEVRREQRP